MLAVSVGVWKDAKAMRHIGYVKVDQDEYVDYPNDGSSPGKVEVFRSVMRTSFGRLATDVDDFYLGSDMVHANIMIRHKGEKEVWNVYLPKKKKTCSNNVFYTSYLAGKDVNGYYQYSANQVFTLDKKGRLYFSGDDSCFLTFQHKTGKDCSHNKKCREKLVDKNIKKCWSDKGMFSYVKDNRLYITGMVINQGRKCKIMRRARVFSRGKGTRLKK